MTYHCEKKRENVERKSKINEYIPAGIIIFIENLSLGTCPDLSRKSGKLR